MTLKNKCPLKNLRTPCDGLMTPDGLCFHHSFLFDFWGCEFGGYNLYSTDKPLTVKRQAFERWLGGLSDAALSNILNS